MDLRSLERMGRRRFMETLAGVGVGSKTLEELAQDERWRKKSRAKIAQKI